MKVECQNVYMLRTPNLPIEYLFKFQKQKKDIYEFIHEEKDLDEFFKRSLLISSPSLYYSYINKPNNTKKYEDLKKSLLKYFLRSVGRPTPYGYFSSVSLGRLGDLTKLTRGKLLLDIRVDYDWINFVVKKLEKLEEVQESIFVCFNTSCYQSGDRIKNPYYTNHGKIENEQQIVRKNSIRNTNLIQLIKQKARKFIKLSDLVVYIDEIYSDVDKEVIFQTLNDLIENEYLFTNLRIPVYCEDALKYVISELEKIEYQGMYLYRLKDIQHTIDIFHKTEEEQVLLDLYKKMEEIAKVSNYLIVNTGNQYLENTLNGKIKNKIEKLGVLLCKIPSSFSTLKKLKNRFLEIYGANVEVPFTEIIDENDFNGQKFIEEGLIDFKKDEKIITFIDSIVQQALIQNNPEIQFYEKDFQTFESETENCGSFDINILISKVENDYKLWLGPNYGSETVGAMFQRFFNCFPEEVFKEYNQLYKREEEKYKNYAIVEIREFRSVGSQTNVVNSRKNYKYYWTIGGVSSEQGELPLDDFWVGMDNNLEMYVYSKSLNKKVKFVIDNMLNYRLLNGVSKILIAISQEYEAYPLLRLTTLSSELPYKYLPRIMFEDIVVLPRQWRIDQDDFACTSFEEFERDIQKYIKQYNMDTVLYLANADNRIFINLKQKKYLHIVYDEYKIKKKLSFTEIETNIVNDTIVKDEAGRGYLNEFVFSLLVSANNNLDEYNYYKNRYSLCKEGRKKLLCEDGWVYFKLYGIENRTNEILGQLLPEFLESIQNPKHFFIRYSDEEGAHLRIRIKFKNENEAYVFLPEVIKWIHTLCEYNLISNVMFDTYFREINRYGGPETINLCENIFFKDSVLVENLLVKYDLNDQDDLEKVYIFGITFILRNLTNDLEDLFGVIDSQSYGNSYRKLYREKNRWYLEYVQSILDNNYCRYIKINDTIEGEKQALNLFSKKVEEQIEKETNTNTKEHIYLSIVHMYCNRMTGDKRYERKYLEIVRDAIYQLVQRKKFMDKTLCKESSTQAINASLPPNL